MKLRWSQSFLALSAVAAVLSGCGGDGADGSSGGPGEDGSEGSKGDPGDAGEPGAPGENGTDGDAGLSTLTSQVRLEPGDASCFEGGIRIDSGVDEDQNGELDPGEVSQSSSLCSPTSTNEHKNFRRISSFFSCTQDDEDCDDDATTAAEIVTASTDGMTLIYSDSPGDRIGFVDIKNPALPVALGTLDVAGEPTSVAVHGEHVLLGVNTSVSLVDPSGALVVVDIETQSVVRTIEVGGQPDSVAVSPDGAFAAVVIENERDEDLNDGELPQLPAGKLVVVELSGAPSTWTTTDVDMTGLQGAEEPTDPEPEFVDINSDNVAVVTLQENNAIALVDLASAEVIRSFSAGTVSLTQIDASEEGALISQTESLNDIPREPDGASWLSPDYFVTADEGDLNGGSRGFTIFNTLGDVVFASGNELEHLTARFGHYPDSRSENKGNEPENVEFGVFGAERYLFVNSERSSMVFVYDVADFLNPVFKQALPAGLGPEGALAIPARNLLVVASEEDSREDGFRSLVNIYQYNSGPSEYPTLVSEDRFDGTPISWGAMSGLAADPDNEETLYAVEDSYYLGNRIFQIDTSSFPARITREIRITDEDDVFASIPAVDLADATVDDDDVTRVGVFDEADLAAMINPDKTVNIDPEGITVASDGGFWVASEGAGTVADGAARPVNSLNFLFKVDPWGVIENVVLLPSNLNDNQLRFGFEGVAEYEGKLYVTFQRVWTGAGDSNVRIGIYDIDAETWDFVFYELDGVESQYGGWVGLSDISSLGGEQFLIVERDNRAGPDAAVKRLYRIDLSGWSDGDIISSGDKDLVRDLMPDLLGLGGLVPEKIEGSAVTPSGNVWIVNDNDGIKDNNGETQLLSLGQVL